MKKYLLLLFLLLGCKDKIPDYPKYIELDKELVIEGPQDDVRVGTIMRLPKGTKIYFNGVK